MIGIPSTTFFSFFDTIRYFRHGPRNPDIKEVVGREIEKLLHLLAAIVIGDGSINLVVGRHQRLDRSRRFFARRMVRVHSLHFMAKISAFWKGM